MDERTAYIIVRLLREVATVGTGARAAALGKPAAGKTGTTNDSFDTWFMGFTHDLVDRRVARLRRERDAARRATRPAAAPRCRSGSTTCGARSAAAPQPEFRRPPASSRCASTREPGSTSGGAAACSSRSSESQPVDAPEARRAKPRVEVQDLFSQ